MDWLLLHGQCSVSDLHSLSAACLSFQTPSVVEDKHESAYFEDDGLYECVGVQGSKFPVLLKSVSQNPEYASIRKVRKLKRERWEEVSEQENKSEICTINISKKTLEPFHCPNFAEVITQQASSVYNIFTAMFHVH